jgi:Skp family chaperone for outer membrane proteins
MNPYPKHINWLAAALLVVMASLVVVQARAFNTMQQLPPAVIATVNLEEVFSGLSEYVDANDRLQALGDNLDAERERRRDQITMLEEERELYAPGSEKQQETDETIALRSYQLQAYIEWAGRKLEIEKARVLRELYENIKVAISEMADENGYDVVFVDDTVVEIQRTGTEQETMRQISARRMLYTNNAIDITQAVIDRMNTRLDTTAP